MHIAEYRFGRPLPTVIGILVNATFVDATGCIVGVRL
jgi:hypothetical protein